jgi:hypothetical protein
LLESMRHLWGRSISSEEMQRHGNLVNLDTTALVALVSELTNCGARALKQMTSEEREKQFPSMAKFVVDQAQSELERPLLPEFQEILLHRLPIISEYVLDEFRSIVLANGGTCENQRAEELLGCLKVVPTMASVRVNALGETGKIKPRHKLVFGTGDFWQAPTLTANMGFVRAVHQTGMALAIIQHRPCALMGR